MLHKLIYHIQTYGVGFTLRLLGSKFFGLRNPYDDLPPAPLSGTFLENHIGQDQSLQIKTQPIDSILIPAGTCPQINVVVDHLEECVKAFFLAAALAERMNGTLRIITRSAYPDPLGFYALMQAHQQTVPNGTEFFSDYDRTSDGQSRYKLTITDQDIFLTASLHGALACVKTTFATPVFCLFSASGMTDEDKQLLQECASADDLYFVTDSEADRNFLLEEVPQLEGRICCHCSSDFTINFMEQLING